MEAFHPVHKKGLTVSLTPPSDAKLTNCKILLAPDTNGYSSIDMTHGHKNLVDELLSPDFKSQGGTRNGVTFSCDEDNSIRLSGTATGEPWGAYYLPSGATINSNLAWVGTGNATPLNSPSYPIVFGHRFEGDMSGDGALYQTRMNVYNTSNGTTIITLNAEVPTITNYNAVSVSSLGYRFTTGTSFNNFHVKYFALERNKITSFHVDFPTIIYGGTYDLITGILESSYDNNGDILAQPVYYKLTPQTITLFSDYNFFYSDNGNLNICYWTQQ